MAEQISGQKMTNSEPIENVVDTFISVRGHHGMPIEYAPILENLLTRVEQKHEKTAVDQDVVMRDHKRFIGLMTST